jgi:hypothetical protein
VLQCIIDGLKVRAAREPSLDKTLLKNALDQILPALLEVPAHDA